MRPQKACIIFKGLQHDVEDLSKLKSPLTSILYIHQGRILGVASWAPAFLKKYLISLYYV